MNIITCAIPPRSTAPVRRFDVVKFNSIIFSYTGYLGKYLFILENKFLINKKFPSKK